MGICDRRPNSFIAGDWSRRHDLCWLERSEFLRAESGRHEEVVVRRRDVVHSSSAIGADGTIYFGAGDFSAGDVTTPGTLYALRPDGSKRWEFVTPLGIVSSPALAADGSIYFGSYDAKLYALRPDGSKQWEFAANDAIYSSPVVAANRAIYFGSFDGKLRALGPDGVERWHFDTSGTIQSSRPSARTARSTLDRATKILRTQSQRLEEMGVRCWQRHRVLARYWRGRNDLLWRFGQKNLRAQSGRLEEMGIRGGQFDFSSPAIATDGTILFWLARQETSRDRRRRRGTLAVHNGQRHSLVAKRERGRRDLRWFV